MRIAWAFTGAGHLLLESVEAMEEIVSGGHEVTILLSGAAEEVLRMYGLFERVRKLSGGYYRELVLESDEGYSFPITGRLSMGRYDLLVVSPVTSNTVAKIVHGIADTLVTNAVAQAGKGECRCTASRWTLRRGTLKRSSHQNLNLNSAGDASSALLQRHVPGTP